MSDLRRRAGLVALATALGVLAFQIVGYRSTASIAALLSPAGKSSLTLPAGFTAQVFASGLEGPRFLEFGPDGRLYVAEMDGDRVTALSDADADGVADSRTVFAGGISSPHSVVWHRGSLYVGVPTGVLRFSDTDGDGRADSRRILVDDYPTEGHSTRTVLFLPDGRMLVSVGSSCNVCRENDARRAAIVVYDDPTKSGGDGRLPKSTERVFARGLRNAVGLVLHPETKEVWATNHGRDWLGDDLPPETIHVVRDGDDYGWPRCHAGDLVDPDFGGDAGCRGVAAPVLKMQAHSAPLGLAFATAAKFPEEYRGDLFVAFHGSWNRSVPTGFKVVRVPIEGGKVAGPAEDFATGFASGTTKVHGRPVGVVFGPDGAMYVSDDKGGFVYRISYSH